MITLKLVKFGIFNNKPDTIFFNYGCFSWRYIFVNVYNANFEENIGTYWHGDDVDFIIIIEYIQIINWKFSYCSDFYDFCSLNDMFLFYLFIFCKFDSNIFVN